MEVNNKIIAVTGAGNGVGRQIALQLLKKGAKVAAIDINKEGLKETLSLSGNNTNFSIHIANITDLSQVKRVLQEILDIYGTLDGLINNAGIIQPFESVKDVSYDIIERVMNVNFYGTLYMIKTFIDILVDKPEAHILNVSSMGGFLPVPGQGIYGSSKAAVKLLTEAMQAELKDTNVHVSLVIPGGIATNIMKNSNIQSKKNIGEDKRKDLLLTPEQAANFIINTMEMNKQVAYIGKDCKAMHMLYKISPKLAGKVILKAMDPSKH